MVKDRTGVRYGRLVAQHRIERPKGPWWLCLCDCGAEKVVRGSALDQTTKSCGCGRAAYRRQQKPGFSQKHGQAATSRKRPSSLYTLWCNIIGRCENPRDIAYHYYGGRGIKMCLRWRLDYNAFAADLGPRPTKRHSIDRIDVDGDYAPANCRWATATEQVRNRRNTIFLECGGVKRPLAEWSELSGVKPRTILHRIHFGWSVESAIHTSVAVRRRHDSTE